MLVLTYSLLTTHFAKDPLSMLRTHQLPGILTWLAALLAAASAQADVCKWRVEHYLQPASEGGASRFCYVVSDGTAAQLVSQPIQGFAWEWGTVYQITVDRERARAQNGSIVTTYKLLSVESQARVPEGTRFQLYLFDRSFIQGQTLLGAKGFQYANVTVEAEFKRRLDNLGGNAARPAIPGVPKAPPADPNAKPREIPEENRRVLLEFSHPKTSGEPLILQGITGASDLGLE